ncbi:hypothetical protein KJ780_04510, partial [Candidatus Micrarchaeota archaeon]|nr:hypothetical protein [Candidatus Micrarchaeota archaeon]
IQIQKGIEHLGPLLSSKPMVAEKFDPRKLAMEIFSKALSKPKLKEAAAKGLENAIAVCSKEAKLTALRLIEIHISQHFDQASQPILSAASKGFFVQDEEVVNYTHKCFTNALCQPVWAEHAVRTIHSIFIKGNGTPEKKQALQECAHTMLQAYISGANPTLFVKVSLLELARGSEAKDQLLELFKRLRADNAIPRLHVYLAKCVHEGNGLSTGASLVLSSYPN